MMPSVQRPTLRLSNGYPDTSPHLADDVRALQHQLVRWGFDLRPDGRFGPSTDAAVRTFQRRKGLKDDGIVGARTWEALLDPAARPIGSGFNPELSTDAAKAVDAQGQSAVVTASGGGAVDDTLLRVPWYSQYDSTHVERAGDKACYRACRAMARAFGSIIPASTQNRIQVATAEDRQGRVTTSPERTAAARSYIDTQLGKRRPVAVGVSHKDADYNADMITDHYVLVVGRQVRAGVVTYIYHDPATKNEATGRAGRFRIDGTTGNLIHDGTVAQGYVYARHTEMAMVVRNAE
jgi:peptidoglycan hydrolase-like protein with peptidoglycan-binding domain